jgi:hypothetical protein
MSINNEITKAINDNLQKNSNFEVIAGLEELTLSDIECIEKLSTTKNVQFKLSYQIIDNTYIKIDYSF